MCRDVCADGLASALLVCRLCSKMKALQVAERDLEQQRKQHHVAMDKLLLQTQSLEQALKTERHVVTEEKCVQHTHNTYRVLTGYSNSALFDIYSRH